MYAAFVKLLNMSAAASILIAAVIVLRFLLRRAPKKYICLLWAIAALRLIVPISISSAVSAYNYIGMQQQNGQVEYVQYNGKSEKPMGEITAFYPEVFLDEAETVQSHRADFYLPTVMGIWAVGFAAMLCYAAMSYRRLRKQTDEAVRFQGNIYRCDHLPSPFILGIVRPKIYLPSDLKEPQRQSVIAHEQAHIRRLDHWWKPMGYLILSLHWFNPLVWLGYALLSRDIETACDERVIAKMSAKQKQDYSETLLQCSMPQKFISACPLAFGETGVKQRIRGILNYRKPTAWIVAVSLVICMFAAATFLTDPVQAEGSVVETTEMPEIYYDLQIGAENVARIEIVQGEETTGIVYDDAKNSMFEVGERVWLAPLDNVKDLLGVTFRAYSADGTLVWERPIHEEARDAAVIEDSGWQILKRNTQTSARSGKVISYGGVFANYGAMNCRIPLTLSYRNNAFASQNTGFYHGEQIVGGVACYPMDVDPTLPDMSWIESIDYPEWKMDGVYYTIEALGERAYILEFNNYLPETEPNALRNEHHLYYVDGMLYDVWFDELQIDEHTKNQIVSSVGFKRTPAEESQLRYYADSVEGLTVYSAPSEESRVVAGIPAGEEFIVSRVERVADALWLYGADASNTVMGWVKSEEDQPEIPQDVSVADSQAAVMDVTTTLYSSPSEAARVIAEVSAGETLYVVREEKVANYNWAYVTNEDKSILGWAKVSDLGNVETESVSAETEMGSDAVGVICSEKELNVRGGPGMTYPALYHLDPGTVVFIQATTVIDGVEWGRIGDDQWVCMNYVAMKGSSAYAAMTGEALVEAGVSGDRIELRSSPSLQARVISTLMPGGKVTVLQKENIAGVEWCYVSDEHVMGWVKEEQLRPSQTEHHDDVHMNDHH